MTPPEQSPTTDADEWAQARAICGPHAAAMERDLASLARVLRAHAARIDAEQTTKQSDTHKEAGETRIRPTG